jgi:hypothetical protein
VTTVGGTLTIVEDVQPLALERGWRYVLGAPSGTQRLGPSLTIQEEALELLREFPDRLQAHGEVADGRRSAEVIERYYRRLLAGTDSSYPETFACEVPNALVVGDHGLVVTDRSEILLQSAVYGGSTAAKLQTVTGLAGGTATATLPGTYVSLLGYSHRAYGHWLIDLLPRLALVPEDEQDFSVLVPGPPRPFQLRLLELLGIEGGRVVSTAGPNVRVERLLLCHPSHRTTRPVGPHLRWVVERLRAAAGAGSEPAPLRLNVSRENRTRRVVNEAELAEILAAHGFETIRPEELDLVEQIRAFASADAIAGTHGSGLLNCVFAPPGARLFEFFHPGYFFPSTLGPATLLGLEHWYLFGQPAGDYYEIRVDAERLDRLLSVGLGASPGPGGRQIADGGLE